MDVKPKILYVDDEEINTLLFEINFKKKYTVTTASNGMEGLMVLEKNPHIDIVISDMKMPGLNGIEFLTKAKERFPLKKYFMLTGYELTSEIQQYIDEGLILKCFRKPFNINEIESEIDKHVRNA